jgi:hypothetical protein
MEHFGSFVKASPRPNDRCPLTGAATLGEAVAYMLATPPDDRKWSMIVHREEPAARIFDGLQSVSYFGEYSDPESATGILPHYDVHAPPGAALCSMSHKGANVVNFIV